MDFKFHVLQSITNNFSEENKVGSGAYGDVYKGSYDGKEIAVKKLHPLQGLDDTAFDNEFRNLSRVNHPNVVRLIGYCYESQHKYVHYKGELVMAKTMDRFLCFEYMQGGSLEKHIADKTCNLDWTTCYKIIKGICEGLNHLHNSQEKPILHLDLNPSNILLDANKAAKISDLGLSKFVDSSKIYETNTLKGRRGYMAPEYIDRGSISKMCDVYSLGVIVIKIMAGNEGYFNHSEGPQEQFIELVSENWKQRLQAVPSSSSSLEIDILRVRRCAEIALRCVKTERKERPSIEDIVHELEELEANIKKMLLSCDDHPMELITAGQKSFSSNILAVDPTIELRFPFETGKDISCCLQLTNTTEEYIAFKIKTNQTKYSTRPNKGFVPPCSKCYVLVTLRAQEKAPANMQCNDMLLVHSANISKNLTPDEFADQDLVEKFMVGKVVEVVRLPIVYVSFD